MQKFLFLILSSASLILVSSCKKYEGEGGKSSISGKIEVHEILHVSSNPSDTLVYAGATEDVYIIYGEDKVTPDDKVECGYDGSFTFEFLQPGTYTIYAYSEIFSKGSNISNNDDDHYTLEVVKQTVELKKKEDLDLGTITLIK